MQNLRSTVILTTTQTLSRGNKILYLVLHKKPFYAEAMEQLEKEIAERLNQFIDRVYNKLENAKFENPEQSIKVLLLKALYRILRNLAKEYEKNLSPADIKEIEEIFQNEEKNIKIEEAKIKDKKEDLADENLNKNIPNNDNCCIQ